MNKSKLFLVIGSLMVIVMIVFVGYAFRHPEMSFGIGIEATYTIYTIYILIMIVMFVLSAKLKK
ncbi:hypothetical protein PV797_16735 [Clostridiaceae bacterium M8S5]|nr:hypothetical protein PV797_16735 [Clostridiaceae bacterium M8S5]